jgi:hypothetical protein
MFLTKPVGLLMLVEKVPNIHAHPNVVKKLTATSENLLFASQFVLYTRYSGLWVPEMEKAFFTNN